MTFGAGGNLSAREQPLYRGNETVDQQSMRMSMSTTRTFEQSTTAPQFNDRGSAFHVAKGPVRSMGAASARLRENDRFLPPKKRQELEILQRTKNLLFVKLEKLLEQ